MKTKMIQTKGKRLGAAFRRTLAPFSFCLLGLSTMPSAAVLPNTSLLNCNNGETGDWTYRGFYIESYPGETLGSLTVYLNTPAASPAFPYQVGITVTEGTYDGPQLGFFWADATIGSAEKAVTINCGNVAVTPGTRLCFKFGINKQPAAPNLYYAVPSFGADPCGVVQTTGTTAPLSAFRRNGVKCIVTGRRILTVDGSNVKIQTAIDAAQPGDTVTVEEGSYFEEIVLRSGIDVKASGEVLLQATEGAAVTIPNCTNTEFSGFTVMPEDGDDPTTGISISGGSPMVKNNTVRGFPRYGIRITGNSNAIVCGNRILDNGDSDNGVVDYGIMNLSSVTLLANNLIKGNEVGCYIAWHASDGAQFVNNTVVDNSSKGLWCHQSNPIVRNNILTGNTTGVSASFANATPVLTYNNVWNNTWKNYDAQQTGVTTPGTGSLSLDPLFADTTDYKLAPASPCIDAGDPSEIDKDLDDTINDMGWTGGACASPEVAPAPFNGFLFTSVGNTPASYIGANGLATVPPTDATALAIPAWKNAPFAGNPRLFGVFGPGVSPVFYTIEHKLASEPAAAYQPLNHSLSKVRYQISGGSIVASLYQVGPQYVAGVPYYRNTSNNSSTYYAHENLRMILRSAKLDDGVYHFRVKAFDWLKNSIPLTGSQTLTLHVNNKYPEVDLISINRDGRPAVDECAILGISSPTENLNLHVTARHPDGFLHNWALNATVGRNGIAGQVGSDSYVPNHDGAISWTGLDNEEIDTAPAMAAGTLLPWKTCAYQFRLTAWSRAIDGSRLVRRKVSFFNMALNLGGADLDADGDVDADDLAIFAAAYGN